MQIVSYIGKKFKNLMVQNMIDTYDIKNAYLVRDGFVFNPVVHKELKNLNYTHVSQLSFNSTNSTLLLNTLLPQGYGFVPENLIRIKDDTNTVIGTFLIKSIIDTGTIEIKNLDGSQVSNLTLTSGVNYTIESNDFFI